MLGRWLPKGIKQWFDGQEAEISAEGSVTISRKQHRLSRKAISVNALKVMYRLKKHGYAAYLVGGGVRDVLLGVPTKDFDVATDATPTQLRRVFENSRIIGRRFRLVHVYYPGEIIEVSTFRAHSQADECEGDMIQSDNTFGTIEEDALRRDFTINAMYYNIADFSIVDFANGMPDLQSRVLRIIGDPELRFREDPVRLLRAIRFTAKLDFAIEPSALAILETLPELLSHVPKSRLLHEFEKLFFQGYAYKTFQLLRQYQYFRILFPKTMSLLANPKNKVFKNLLDRALKVTDERFLEKKSLNPGFLIGVMLWPVYQFQLEQERLQTKRAKKVAHSIMSRVIYEQQAFMAIPKRYMGIIQSTWMLQFYLEKRQPRRVLFVLKHRYFRAAIDLMQLRVDVGEPLSKTLSWWRDIQAADYDEQQLMIDQLREKQLKHKKKTKKN